MSKPAASSRTSAPMIRERRMFPTRSYTTSGQSTQCSCTSTQRSPRCADTAATWRVWFDCTPPIETSVSQPRASASATRYSSLRVLLPPKARPELQSSRLAQIAAPPRWCVSLSSRWMGDGPKVSGYRSKSSSMMTPAHYRPEIGPDVRRLRVGRRRSLVCLQDRERFAPRRVDRHERREARDSHDAMDRLGLGRDHELETAILLPHALARRDDQPDHRRIEERARAQVDEQAAVRARARER